MNIDTETTDQAGTYARYSSSASSGLRNARCRATARCILCALSNDTRYYRCVLSSEGTSLFDGISKTVSLFSSKEFLSRETTLEKRKNHLYHLVPLAE